MNSKVELKSDICKKQMDSGSMDSGSMDSGSMDSGRTDSSRTDSSRTDSSRTDSSRTDSSRTDSSRSVSHGFHNSRSSHGEKCLNPGRRAFIKKGAAAAAFSASLMPLSLPAVSREPELKIGYLPITDAAPLLIAHSLGFFRDEGLNVPRPVMVRSWTVLTESFVGGKFNFTICSFPYRFGCASNIRSQ